MIRVRTRHRLATLTLVGATSIGTAFLMTGCTGDIEQSGSGLHTPSPGQSGCKAEENMRPFDCAPYRSSAGRDGSGNPVEWLSANPITVTVTEQNDTSTLVVSTPCNAINVPVTITSKLISPKADELTSGAMGCSSPKSDYESWTRNFISEPMTFSLNGDQLTLKNSMGEIQLTKTSHS